MGAGSSSVYFVSKTGKLLIVRMLWYLKFIICWQISEVEDYYKNLSVESGPCYKVVANPPQPFLPLYGVVKSEPQNALTKKFTKVEWKALKELRASSSSSCSFNPR